MVFIPAQAFKNCLDEAAKYLSIKKKGNQTYTKHFEAGVNVFEPAALNVHKDDTLFEKLFLNLDGKAGSGKRGYKNYPYVEKGWVAEVQFIILDETVLQSYSGNKTMTVFEHVLRCAGMYVGIGRWNPKHRGSYGRFAVENIAEVSNEFLDAAE